MKLESELVPETAATPELAAELLRDAERRGTWLVAKDADDDGRFVQVEVNLRRRLTAGLPAFGFSAPGFRLLAFATSPSAYCGNDIRRRCDHQRPFSDQAPASKGALGIEIGRNRHHNASETLRE